MRYIYFKMKINILTRFCVLIGLMSILVLSGSCGSRKKLVYFQGDNLISDTINVSFTLKYEVGDIVSIEISGPDPIIVAPFNQAKLDRQGSNQYTSYENGASTTFGYLIDLDGNVVLPIIGKMKIAGLNNTEAILLIESALTEYVRNPIVSILLLNFKVTVLGEVQNPGTFSVPNGRCTILEAIGISKDLRIDGVRNNVLVIRTENGKKTEYRVDLTTKDVFSSSVYYLKQNDIVYVEPNKNARFGSTVVKSTLGIIFSFTSLMISTIVVIFN